MWFSISLNFLASSSLITSPFSKAYLFTPPPQSSCVPLKALKTQINFINFSPPSNFEGTEMGNKGASPPLAICCMCGDHGLPQELFRCKLCLIRSQHKYCSNLYPKVESYRACNWCLKQAAAVRIVTTKEATTANGNNGNNGSSSGSSAVKLNRGAFSQQLKKAVKKQKVVQEASSSPNKTDSPGMRSEEVPRRLGKGKQVFRGKVRRYKLLEEVSSKLPQAHSMHIET